MANTDWPAGFRVGYTKHGGPAAVHRWESDGSAIIYPGDLVKKDGSGKILTLTATNDNPIGVAATYAAATASAEVFVYDDLANTIFIVQSDDATLADDTANGNYFDVVITTGDTTTLRSKHELNGDASTSDTLELIDIVGRPDNAWGANVDVYVKVRVDADANVIAVTA
ncbi:MAG: hypothetical protein ACYTEO_19195 [Planctomycetota bacterium]|jgi:hypothetical protein